MVIDLWACPTRAKEEPGNANLCKSTDQLPRSIKDHQSIAYSCSAASNHPDPKGIESSINVVPSQPCADRDHVLQRVVIDFRELLQADVDASGRRESRVRLMTTTLDLWSADLEHWVSFPIMNLRRMVSPLRTTH